MENTATLELEIEEEVIPFEYQIFGLALRQAGAIARFAEDLPAEYVGAIHGETGIHEFYKAFLHFYEKTGLDPIDPIAWKAWVQSETDIADALGGIGPVTFFVDTVLNMDLTTVDSVVKVLRYRANQRLQLNNMQRLQQLVSQKGHKSDEDVQRIVDLTDQIRTLESNLGYNPLDVVVTAGDIASRADVLMDVPPMLMTPFVSYNKALGYCVDPETEILTKDGWVHHTQLQPHKTEILEYSLQNNNYEWHTLKDLYVNEQYEGPMVFLGNDRFNAFVTPQHKWAIKSRRTNTTKMKRTYELPLEGSIVRNAVLSEREEVDGPYTDDWIRLCAWYFTAGARYSELAPKLNGDVIAWGLSGKLVDELTTCIVGEHKTPNPKFISQLSSRQAQIFVDTCKKGDGTKDSNQFHQHNKERMDGYMAAAVLAGYTVTIDSSGTTCTTNKAHAALSKIKRTEVDYSGTIWCPVTNNGYWVARRKGKVYVTGNTEEGGCFRGALHAIIASSGKGKSTFVKVLTNHWLDQGYTVLFINFEEARDHWERILMTQIIKENVYAKYKKWSDEEKNVRIEKFRGKLSEWGDRLMVRHSPDSSYYDDLELWLKDIMGHNSCKPDVVVIDTLQSMFGRGGGSRWEQYERMMVRLEKLAKDMNAVFLLTAQQNVNAMKEKRDVIEQQDAGGSVSIIQKCSVATFITEKKLISGDESEDEFLMQLQIPKNRITGSTFTYDPPLVLYNDETKSYEEFSTPDASLYKATTTYDNSDIFGDDFNL